MILSVCPAHKRCYKERNKGKEGEQQRVLANTGGSPLVLTSCTPHSPSQRQPSLPPHSPFHQPLPSETLQGCDGPWNCLMESGEQFLQRLQGCHKLQEMKALSSASSSPITPDSLRPAQAHNVGNQSRIPSGSSSALGLQSPATRVREGLPASLGSAFMAGPHRVDKVGQAEGAGAVHSKVAGPPGLKVVQRGQEGKQGSVIRTPGLHSSLGTVDIFSFSLC